MNSAHLARLFSSPSVLSGFSAIATAFLILGYNIWPYLTYDRALYDFLYGELGVITALEQYPSLISNSIQSLSENTIVYIATIVIIAGGVGVGVFFVIRSLHHVFSGLVRNEERKEEEMRLAFQTLGLAAWIGYAFLFFTVLLPNTILLARIAADGSLTPLAISMIVASLAIISLLLHVHVILARVTFMKPRLFGSATSLDNTMFFD